MKNYVYQKLSNLYIWLAHVAPWPLSKLAPFLDKLLVKFEATDGS